MRRPGDECIEKNGNYGFNFWTGKGVESKLMRASSLEALYRQAKRYRQSRAASKPVVAVTGQAAPQKSEMSIVIFALSGRSVVTSTVLASFES